MKGLSGGLRSIRTKYDISRQKPYIDLTCEVSIYRILTSKKNTILRDDSHRIVHRLGTVWITVLSSGSPCVTLFITVLGLRLLTENLQYQLVTKDQAVPAGRKRCQCRFPNPATRSECRKMKVFPFFGVGVFVSRLKPFSNRMAYLRL